MSVKNSDAEFESAFYSIIHKTGAKGGFGELDKGKAENLAERFSAFIQKLFRKVCLFILRSLE